MRELRLQGAQTLTGWRIGAIGTLALVALAIGAAMTGTAVAFGALELLTLPGAVWALWAAAGLGAEQREDATESWRWQSGRPALALALEGTLGACAPGLALVALGTLGALGESEAHDVALSALWIATAVFALVAIGRWRRNCEPRARHGWRGRILVTGALVLALAAAATGRLPELDIARAWLGWAAAGHGTAWALGGGVATLAIALWAAARAEHDPGGPPWAFLCAGMATGIWLSGSIRIPELAATWTTSGWAAVIVWSLAATLVQPREAPPPIASPLRWSTALIVVWSAIALIEATAAGASAPTLHWIAAIGAYAVRDLAIFELIRRTSPGERHPGLLWATTMLAVWIAAPLIGAQAHADPALVAALAAPWHHGTAALEASAGAALGYAFTGALAAWGTALAWRAAPAGATPAPPLIAHGASR